MPTAAVIALAAAQAFAGAPTATVVVDSYRALIRSSDGVSVRTVRAPDEIATRFADPERPRELRLFGSEYIGRTRSGSGSILRGVFAVAPDGFPAGVDRYTDLTAFALAEARVGRLRLAPRRAAGRPALWARVELPANECAALPPRRVTIALARRTLLPLRAIERARRSGRVLSATTYVYRGLNRRFPAAVFAPPPLGRSPSVTRFGFRLAAPGHAAGPLPYVPRLPTVLPRGFELAVAGWARRSGITGAEGSIPPSPWLFAASFRRGQERIDITQRVAGRAGDWPDDPFGAECTPLRTGSVDVGGVEATYGIGPTTVPHLYWRDGPLRYTVSGPFPREDLVAIAASLQPLGS